MKKNLVENNIEEYFRTRNNKYEKKENVQLVLKNKKVQTISYFPQWFSGFVEREGCFSIRKTGEGSFCIGQKDDLFLIEAIKEYLQRQNKI